MHLLDKGHREKEERRNGKKRDFYNCAKVDTHIHAASSMTMYHLDRFMKKNMDVEVEAKVCQPMSENTAICALQN